MKKLLFVFFLFYGISVLAQDGNITLGKDSIETIDMNRTFSVGGRAIMCLRSANANKKELKALTWTLENNRAGNQNFVMLKVQNVKTEQMEAMNTWNGGVNIEMTKRKDGTFIYNVYDDLFTHLRIVQMSKDSDIYIILFYSELINK